MLSELESLRAIKSALLLAQTQKGSEGNVQVNLKKLKFFKNWLNKEKKVQRYTINKTG